ncbi:uncharacterized protein LOC124273203 isoform X2 [Haliotis rubra]|uniref:uncharacterized protein LOC124273203 isoform X2 n=1 Tax=Haliotis rubra TaxID=36100 RepID=UPI001EE5F5B1|nr:uncharacterized protein LOC124273203 isoform X2 [Haliotis rubra]
MWPPEGKHKLVWRLLVLGCVVGTIVLVINSFRYTVYMRRPKYNYKLPTRGGHADKVHRDVRDPRSFTGTFNQIQPVDPKKKYIVCVCIGSYIGGLSDRLKGFVTGYLLSQMLGREFGIVMEAPCNLAEFWQPNMVNWRLDAGQIRARPQQRMRVIDNKQFALDLQNNDLNDIFKANVVNITINVNCVGYLMRNPLFKALEWARNKTEYDIYKHIIGLLFRLSPSTADRLNALQHRIGDKVLICAHLRMGKSQTMPNDEYRKTRKPKQRKVLAFLQSWNQSDIYKIFIATDSENVRKRFQKAFPETYVENEGPIVHIDRSKNYTCEGLEKVILDLHVLSMCRVLVMSISGLSRTAAILRGSDEHVYIASPINISITGRLPL